MNSFGKIYATTIFGESHGVEVGVVIDGCPAGIELSEQDLLQDLDRRRAGAKGTTSRKEGDKPRIVSGTFNNFTTGAPITILFTNENTRSGDYKNLILHPRPGHADFVARHKYKGFSDYRGGGHFSGRITLGAVASGIIAKKILALEGITINAEITSLSGECDKTKYEAMITKIMSEEDSLGGIVECRASGVPIGLGEPFFDSVESVISHAIFSMPGVRGVEFGEGFAATLKKGSQHNDPIIEEDGRCATNNAGGINGGISNGNDIVLRVAVKPTPSISKEQLTYNYESCSVEKLKIKGRHDACIVLRTPVIVEALTAISLVDLLFCRD